MAPRASLDDKLAALRALRGQALTPEEKAEVRKRIGDRSNLVAASAAAIAGECTLIEAAGDLVAAFDRFLVDPAKNDKLCRAKIAAIQALDRMEHQDPDVFRRAAAHVQFEPVWGGSEDSAPPLRAAGLVALARVEGSRCLATLVDALADPAKDVRIAAAVALGAVGGEAAGLVLRLKARLGDGDPDVVSECFGGLLAADPDQYLPFVAGFLDPLRAETCEAAALALGRSRLAGALGPLSECWGRVRFPDLGQQVLLAIAILRRPEAIDFLAGLVASASEPDAVASLSALKIFDHDPKVRDRVARIVADRGSPTLRARFDREFGP